MAWQVAGIPLLAERIQGCFRRHYPVDLDWEHHLRLEERHRERERIARDLHDTLLQGLFSASMQLQVADEWLPADSPVKPLLSRVLDLIAKGIADGRIALQGLRTAQAPTTNLEQALSDFKDELIPSDRARLRIVIVGPPKPLAPKILEQVYWIIREALLNALRHSKATKVEAEIEYLPRRLRVIVRDNGTGIDPQLLRANRKSHWGLTGMRERAATIGGEVHICSRRGAGTELEFLVAYRGILRHPRSR